jgi:hypothetical protein
MALVAALALAGTRAGVAAVRSTRVQLERTKAEWVGRGCLATVRAIAGAGLRQPRRGTFAYGKRTTIESAASESRTWIDPRCTITTEPLGTRFDVNGADSASLSRLLQVTTRVRGTSTGLPALLDWLDEDTVTRPGGAEWSWYAARKRPRPTDGPLRAPEEISLVRGFEDEGALIAATSVDPARIALLHAPPSVIATLPGFDEELVRFVVAIRTRLSKDDPVTEMSERAPAHLRERLWGTSAALQTAAVLEPDGWLVSAVVQGQFTGRAVVVQHLLRVSDRSVVASRELSW